MAFPQLATTNQGPTVDNSISTIATSAVLFDVHVSTWTGRKRDKKTSAEVNADKQTRSSKAASVIKNLMTDDKDLDAIRAYAQDTRLWVQHRTYAWGDGGTRLLPTGLMFDVTSEMDARIAEFERLCHVFLAGYSTKVSAAAFKLGQLFDRAEFPDEDSLRLKFSMRYVIMPVPTAGDFRVDVQNDVGEMLKKKYSVEADKRVAEMLREPWERAYEGLQHIKSRMDAALEYEPEAGADGRRKPKLFQSMVDNNLELANLLDKLNITKDPQLADCAARMRRLLTPLDMKSVRESPDMQKSIKTQVEDILGTFDFGPLE